MNNIPNTNQSRQESARGSRWLTILDWAGVIGPLIIGIILLLVAGSEIESDKHDWVSKRAMRFFFMGVIFLFSASLQAHRLRLHK